MAAVLPPSTKKKHKSNAQSGRPAGSPFFYEHDPSSLRAQPIPFVDAQGKTVRCFFDPCPPIRFRVFPRSYTDTLPPADSPGSAHRTHFYHTTHTGNRPGRIDSPADDLSHNEPGRLC